MDKFNVLPTEIKQSIFAHALCLSAPTQKFYVMFDRIFKKRAADAERRDTALSIILVCKTFRQLMEHVVDRHVNELGLEIEFYKTLLSLAWLACTRVRTGIETECVHTQSLWAAERSGNFKAEVENLPFAPKAKAHLLELHRAYEYRGVQVLQLWIKWYDLWYEICVEFGLLLAFLRGNAKEYRDTNRKQFCDDMPARRGHSFGRGLPHFQFWSEIYQTVGGRMRRCTHHALSSANSTVHSVPYYKAIVDRGLRWSDPSGSPHSEAGTLSDATAESEDSLADSNVSDNRLEGRPWERQEDEETVESSDDELEDSRYQHDPFEDLIRRRLAEPLLLNDEDPLLTDDEDYDADEEEE